MRWRYNAVDFLQNSHNRHPIARSLVRGMGCLSWKQTTIYVLPQYRRTVYKIMNRIITIFDNICHDSWRMFNFNLKIFVYIPTYGFLWPMKWILHISLLSFWPRYWVNGLSYSSIHMYALIEIGSWIDASLPSNISLTTLYVTTFVIH